MSREAKEFIIIVAAILGLVIHIGIIYDYESTYNQFFTVAGFLKHLIK